MRRYKVRVSGEARQMLLEHVQFLAQVNKAAAKTLKDRIIAEIRSLETMPMRYPYLEPEDRRSPYRKMFIPNRYLVLYLVDGDTVYVEYILDCRQDCRWLPEDGSEE